jgi:hypothetical protein
VRGPQSGRDLTVTGLVSPLAVAAMAITLGSLLERPRARRLVFRWRPVGGPRHESKNGMNPRESPIPGSA